MILLNNSNNYFFLASYPRSGNTWCRIFIAQILKFTKSKTGSVCDNTQTFNLNEDLQTGAIMSNKDWIDDQIGINSCYLHHWELDKIRGNISQKLKIFSNSPRFHKVHDAFKTHYSNGKPIVPIEGCMGA